MQKLNGLRERGAGDFLYVQMTKELEGNWRVALTGARSDINNTS